MENYQRYLNPQTLANLEGLDLQARMIVEGYVAGQHASPYHGFSVEFAQHREYVPGDDIKPHRLESVVAAPGSSFSSSTRRKPTSSDWTCMLDTSESMAYASTGNVSKLQYAQFIAAALGYMVLRQQDSVGLALFDDAVRRFVRPSGQPSHLKELLRVMDVTPAREKSDIGIVFNDLAERFKKRGVVVVLSDLLDEVPRIIAGLKHFRHRRHEVIIFHILDPAEVDFPFRDTTLFKGMEGMPDVVAEPHGLRKAYQEELRTFLDALKRGCQSIDIDYVPLRTDQDLDGPLTSYLASRSLRVR